MDEIFTIKSLDEINEVAARFISQYREHKVMALYGSMGVGKTTFVKALCEVMEVEDIVNSPSFAIINEYGDKAGDIIYHFDFYRLKDVNEAYDLGYEDYLYSGNLCLIEWPEKIEPILPEDILELHFEQTESGERTITVKKS